MAATAPKLSCDCHMHVFGPRARFPLVAGRAYTPAEAPIEDYRASHRPLGLERVVLVQASVYGSDNRCMLEAIARLGERARGVAVIDPGASEAELSALHRGGVRGIRLNLATHGKTSREQAADAIRHAARQVAPLGWHLQLYLEPAILAGLAELIADLELPVVVDHMGRPEAAAGVGQPGFAALLELIATGRVWVKLAGADRIANSNEQFAAVAPFAKALIARRPDRLVWGSDWPHIGWHSRATVRDEEVLPFRTLDEARLLGLLDDWSPDASVRERILVANPAELYGF